MAYQESGESLRREITDEMAVPSYIEGAWLSRYIFWGKLRHVMRAAQLSENAQVFDFGCGTGILLPGLVGDGRIVFATDLHLEIARNLARRLNLQSVEFLSSDCWQEALPDGQIDTIIAANVLEHFKNRREILSILGRKLTPTGRLVVSGPTENWLYRLGRRMVGFSGHYHVTTVFHVFDDARAVGLRQITDKSFPFAGPLCLYKIAAFTYPLTSSSKTQTIGDAPI